MPFDAKTERIAIPLTPFILNEEKEKKKNDEKNDEKTMKKTPSKDLL